jgi:hypothetical protein
MTNTHVEVGSGESRLEALHHRVFGEGPLQVDEVVQVGPRGGRLRAGLDDGHHRGGGAGGAPRRDDRLGPRDGGHGHGGALQRGGGRALHMEAVPQGHQLGAQAAEALLQVDGFVRRRRIWKNFHE